MSKRAIQSASSVTFEPAAAVEILARNLNYPKAMSDYLKALSIWYVDRPAYAQLEEFTGFADRIDPQQAAHVPLYLGQLAFFKGSLLGLRAVALAGFDWVGDQDVVSERALDCGSQPGCLGPEAKAQGRAGLRTLKGLSQTVVTWGIRATGDYAHASTFATGMGWVLQTGQQLSEARFQQDFAGITQQLHGDELAWQAVEQYYDQERP